MEKHAWLVSCCGSLWDNAVTERVIGTKEEIRKYLLDLVTEEREEKEKDDGDETWDYGAETLDDVYEINNDGDDRIYASACFDDGHSDYVARIETDEIIVVTKEGEDVKDWFITIGGSDIDNVYVEKIRASKEDARKYIFGLCKEAMDNQEENDWEFGTDTLEDVQDMDDGGFYGFACYHFSHDDYTARIDDGSTKEL